MGGKCCFGETPPGGCHSKFDCAFLAPCDCPPPPEECIGGAVCGVQAGSVYVYRFNGVSWVEEGKLIASDSTDGDFFGRSVSISGNRAVVGA